MDSDGNELDTNPVTFPFTVSDSDPEIFTLTVGPGPTCDCEWTANLAYTQDGKSYTALIDDHGKPFHAVPTDHLPTYSLVNGYLDGPRYRQAASTTYSNWALILDQRRRSTRRPGRLRKPVWRVGVA